MFKERDKAKVINTHLFKNVLLYNLEYTLNVLEHHLRSQKQ